MSVAYVLVDWDLETVIAVSKDSEALASLASAQKSSVDICKTKFVLSLEERIAKNISDFRRNAKLTQQELGDIVGLSRESIANIESNRQGVSAVQAVKIALALNVEVNELLETK